MTVKDLLKLMAHNPGLTFTIYESDGLEVITFEAAGYEAISEKIGDRELGKITIAEERNYIKLYLKEIPVPDVEPEPDTPPTDEEP